MSQVEHPQHLALELSLESFENVESAYEYELLSQSSNDEITDKTRGLHRAVQFLANDIKRGRCDSLLEMNRERFTDIFLKILHKAVENLTLAVQMCIEDSKGKILEYKNASYISTQFERLKDIALQISTLQTNWYARLENTHIVNDGIQDIVVDTQDRL